jgi:AraC-like DNA-binding protein
VTAHGSRNDAFRLRRTYRSATPTAVAPMRIAAQVVDYIDRNYARPITLRHVAEAVGYSSCHLTHTFARATGTPVTAWIIRRRIEAAKELLSKGDASVAAVCQAVGFNDLCYFSRQFARHVGTRPGRFRATTSSSCAGPAQR